MPDPAPHNPPNKELQLHIAAILYLLSRAAVVTFAFAVPAIYFLKAQVEVPLVLGGAGLVTLLCVLYYFAAARLSCVACHSPVLMDNGNRKHAHAKRIPGLSHRARVAWDILFQTNYQCMYCNTRCRSKKRWDGSPAVTGAAANRLAAKWNGAEEVFPDSPFNKVAGLPGELTSLIPLPSGEVSPFSAPAGRNPAAPLFPAPGQHTAPIPVAGAEASTASVRIAAMSSPERAAGAGGSGPALSPAKSPSPVPWNIPVPVETPAQDNPMNRPSTETPQTPPGPNPFLASAPALPPPVSLAPASQTQPLPDGSLPPFHQEFPFNSVAAPASEGPAPWTLPSMPAPAFLPSPLQPAPPEAAAAAPQACSALSAPAADLTTAGLLQEVISTLEAGQRAMAGAFQSMIVKLEASLTASRPAPSGTVMEPLFSAPSIPEPPPAVELPALLTNPEPVAPPRETTAPVMLPPMLMPAAAMTPAPQTVAPAESPPATQRRKFARPPGLVAQQLTSALHEVFEPLSAPVSVVANGEHPAPPEPALPRIAAPATPLDAAPVMPPPPPAARPQVPAPEVVYSPFAVSSTPLTSPEGLPREPVPFTCLKNNGDHFVPDASAPPESTYDPLDDTVLPWMQPLASHPAHN